MLTDDNRDLNDHAENDLKRQRNNYNGDQLYSNVSKVDKIFFFFLTATCFSILNFFSIFKCIQLRSKLPTLLNYLYR